MLAIIIGILFIALPETSANVLCTISGIMLAAVGAVSLVAAFSGPGTDKHSLILGIALMLAGVFCIVRPASVMSILAAIFGIFIVIDGTITLIDAIDCAKAKIEGWFVIMLISLVSIALGAVVMFVGSNTLMYIAGIGLIVEGVLVIVTLCLFGARIREAKRIIGEIVSVESADAPAGETAAESAAAAIEAAPAKTDEEIEQEIEKLGQE